MLSNGTDCYIVQDVPIFSCVDETIIKCDH